MYVRLCVCVYILKVPVLKSNEKEIKINLYINIKKIYKQTKLIIYAFNIYVCLCICVYIYNTCTININYN